MPEKRFKAVIFDMDGVIVDSEPLHRQVEMALFDELGITVTTREYAEYMGMNNYEMWTRMRSRHGIVRSVDDLVRLGRERFREFSAHHDVPLVPGVADLVRDLAEAGLLLALASSASEEQIANNLVNTGLVRFFSVRISGDSVRYSKPHPAVFLRAAEVLGVDPEQCAVVEDAPNGVVAARSAGMYCIGFVNHTSGSPDLAAADTICHSMAELRHVLL